MDIMTGRCRAEFIMAGDRCEIASGHEGLHVKNGFAQWNEDLSQYPSEPVARGGLLDLLDA